MKRINTSNTGFYGKCKNFSSIISKEILAIFTLLIFSSMNISAQFTERYWEDGSLTWEDDFLVLDTADVNAENYFTYYLDYYYGKLKQKDTVFYYFKAENFTDGDSIRALDIDTSKSLLTYYQTIFDISELHKRRLQNDFFQTNFFYAPNKLDLTYDNTESDVLLFSEETKSGSDIDEMQRWADSIQLLINGEGNKTLPKYTLSNNAFSSNIGLGYTKYNSEIEDYIKGSVFFKLGFTYLYKKWFVNLDGTISTSKLKKEIQGKYLWLVNDKVQQYNIFLNTGFDFRIRRFQFSPYVGIGIHGHYLSYTESDIETNLEGNVYFSPQVGMNFDYFFKINTFFNRSSQDYYQYSSSPSVESHGLRLNINYIPVKYDKLLVGNASPINFSLSYITFFRKVTTKI